MCAEETKDKGKKDGFEGCGCNPRDFQKFFEKFSGQFCGEDGFTDCAAFMKACCGQEKEKNKSDS